MDAGGPRLEGIRARPGTLVVAAEGVHSALRRQHLPHAVPADTGTVTIFGMAPAGSLAPDGLPPDLREMCIRDRHSTTLRTPGALARIRSLMAMRAALPGTGATGVVSSNTASDGSPLSLIHI